MSLKRFNLTVLTVLWACSCFAKDLLPERVYTLEKSVEDALFNNQSILFAKEEIKFAEQRVKEANSQIYPLVELQSSASRFGVQELYPLSTEFGTVLVSPEMDDDKTYLSAKIALKQVIYGGGRIISTMRLASASLKKAKIHYNEITGGVIRSVKSVFYSNIALEERLQNCEEILKRFEILEAQYRGRLSSSVMLELLMEKLKITTSLESLKRERRNKLMEYISALNIEQDVTLSFQGKLDFQQIDTDINKCLAWADEYRPEMKLTQYQEQIDALMVGLSRSERYPQVLFGTNYEFSGQEFPLENENWNATLSMKLPIFDGWAQWARIRQNRSLGRQSKLTQAKTKDEIHMQVRKAYAEYNDRSMELDSLIEQKKEIDSLISKLSQFSGDADNAVSKGIKILNYQYEINDRYIQTLFEAVNSKVELEYAVGKNLE